MRKWERQGEELSGEKEQKVRNVAIPRDRKILYHYNTVFCLCLFSPLSNELYKLSQNL